MRIAQVVLMMVIAVTHAACGGGSGEDFDYKALRSCLEAKRVGVLPGYTPQQMGVTAPVQRSLRIGFPFLAPPLTTDAASVVVTRDRRTLDRFVRETIATYQRLHPELQKATPASSEEAGILIRRSRVGILWDSVHEKTREIVSGCLDESHA
jgi:hypothetical protein